MADKYPIWKEDKTGKLYHEDCFEVGESKDGFTQVASLDDIDADAECASCDGQFLIGVYETDDDDDDEC